jgi:hypothetical protein
VCVTLRVVSYVFDLQAPFAELSALKDRLLSLSALRAQHDDLRVAVNDTLVDDAFARAAALRSVDDAWTGVAHADVLAVGGVNGGR